MTFEKSQGTKKGQPYLLGSRQDQWTNGTLRSCNKAWLFSHACFKARNWLCVSILGSKRKKDHIRIQTFINQRYLFSKFPVRKLAKFCLYGVLYVIKCKKMKCCLRNREIGSMKPLCRNTHICLEIRGIDHFGAFVFLFLSYLALAHTPRHSECVTTLLLH